MSFGKGSAEKAKVPNNLLSLPPKTNERKI
jgi:hypothetical protein